MISGRLTGQPNKQKNQKIKLYMIINVKYIPRSCPDEPAILDFGQC